MNLKIIELTPNKFEKILKECPIAYIPISPIEWHGNHLPFGTDPIRAEWVINSVWKVIGGVLFPTEYCGTDGYKTKVDDKYWYLETIIGEKLKGNFLVEEQLFLQKVICLVNNIKRNGFKILVICTGHLSPQQLSILEKIEHEESSSEFNIILWHSEKAKFPKEIQTDDYLHAGVEETSEMLYISPDLVDVNELGKSNCEIKLGLVDSLQEQVSVNLGEKRLKLEKEQLISLIKSELSNIKDV